MTDAPDTEKDLLPRLSRGGLRTFFGRGWGENDTRASKPEKEEGRPTKWSMGILNDRQTHEVPGSVLLLTGQRNEPLGLHNAPARTSSSSLPSSHPSLGFGKPSKSVDDKKKTKDGAIILEPQPDDSHNDPLNWPSWRRDIALLSLGYYCMLGGGMTPILAAGFTNVAQTYDVTVPQIALTTGLYMMGLGIGSVVASPTAILYGKRPVYLVSAILFILTSVWCATSPSYVSLVIARIIQGISVSPVECLPSATIAEIFFLHERAYRIGIYTLLLLGGKNLIPLISAVIIQSLSWRWVFWIIAMMVGFCWILLFLFVPETFWDRTPRPKHGKGSHDRPALFGLMKLTHTQSHHLARAGDADKNNTDLLPIATSPLAITSGINTDRNRHSSRSLHVGFVAENMGGKSDGITDQRASAELASTGAGLTSSLPHPGAELCSSDSPLNVPNELPTFNRLGDKSLAARLAPPTPGLYTFNSASYERMASPHSGFPWLGVDAPNTEANGGFQSMELESDPRNTDRPPGPKRYTTLLKEQPRLSFGQQLKPWNGRLHHDNWFRVAVRPFILFAYPAVLWSAVVYSCSVGWLIVLSESVAELYRSQSTYNFSALSTGLIYLSPFVGGILGTAVAGKVSDIIVRAMSRRNGGVYEPEFRLVMAVPITVATVIGLMGFGWSAQVHDAWIVPTIFFGIISFGCSLGSTTAITFCVDSYRAYAGEALVTLNFSKNIFHGLVFSLFFNNWLVTDGSKNVFVAIGGIQLALMLLTIPMYIFGKRARMWTVRKNFMEKF